MKNIVYILLIAIAVSSTFCERPEIEAGFKDALQYSIYTYLMENEEDFSSFISILEKGGIVKKSVIKSLDYLVVGGLGSNLYSEGSKGNKILRAEEQSNTTILTEDEFFEAINY